MVTAMVLAISAPAYASGDRFAGHWAEETINKWIELGFIASGGDQFQPNINVTRAEFMNYVNMSMGFEAESDEVKNYTDVPEDAWYYSAIARALEAGYIKGISETLMAPDSLITREQAFVIIGRLRGTAVNDAEILDRVADRGKISKWAEGELAGAILDGLVAGIGNARLDPQSNLTHAQAITVLDRVYRNERVYGFPGIYGPDEGETELSGVVVAGPGVTLRNVIVDYLEISASVGDGEAYLKNITVLDQATVNGGGKDTVYFEGCNIKQLVVTSRDVRVYYEDGTIEFLKNDDGQVVLGPGAAVTDAYCLAGTSMTVENGASASRITAVGSSVEVQTGAQVSWFEIRDDSKLTLASGVIVEWLNTNQSVISLADEAKINKLSVSGSGTLLNNSGVVANIVVSGGITVTGKGVIESADVYTKDTAKFETMPDKVDLHGNGSLEGYTGGGSPGGGSPGGGSPGGGSPGGGSPGGGGGSTPPANKIDNVSLIATPQAASPEAMPTWTFTIPNNSIALDDILKVSCGGDAVALTCVAASAIAGSNEFNENVPSKALAIAPMLGAALSSHYTVEYEAPDMVKFTANAADTLSPVIILTLAPGRTTVGSIIQEVAPNEVVTTIPGIWTVTFDRAFEPYEAIRGDGWYNGIATIVDYINTVHFNSGTAPATTLDEQLTRLASSGFRSYFPDFNLSAISGGTLSFEQKVPGVGNVPVLQVIRNSPKITVVENTGVTYSWIMTIGSPISVGETVAVGHGLSTYFSFDCNATESAYSDRAFSGNTVNEQAASLMEHMRGSVASFSSAYVNLYLNNNTITLTRTGAGPGGMDMKAGLLTPCVVTNTSGQDGGVRGIWSTSFSSNFVAGDSVTVNGYEYTCVAGTAGAGQFSEGTLSSQLSRIVTLANSDLTGEFVVARVYRDPIYVLTFTQTVPKSPGAAPIISVMRRGATDAVYDYGRTSTSYSPALDEIKGKWGFNITADLAAGDIITVDGINYVCGTNGFTPGFRPDSAAALAGILDQALSLYNVTSSGYQIVFEETAALTAPAPNVSFTAAG